MSDKPISQFSDSGDVRGGDLLLISRQSGAGWASLRASLSYVLTWLGVGKPGGIAPLDSNGALLLGGMPVLQIDAAGNLILLNVPTSDPGVKNALWNNEDVLCISSGT